MKHERARRKTDTVLVGLWQGVPKLPLPVLHMFESSSQQRRAREML